MSGLLGHRGLLMAIAAEMAPGSTWDPSHKDSAIALSNGDLTATQVSSGSGNVRGTKSHASGKWYFELRFDSGSLGSRPAFGVCNASLLSATEVGTTLDGWAFLADGRTFHSSAKNYGTALALGDIVMVKLDLDLHHIWWGKNGSWFSTDASPAYTDVVGPVFPAVSPSTGHAVTARFRAADLSYSPPAGYSAWG